MNGKHLDVQQLNQRRHAAVRLRQQGRMLNEIAEATGLSVPTIIAACKAYDTGGWDSVDVRRRGRVPGEGRMLDEQSKDAILHDMLHKLPEHFELPGLLWQNETLRAYLEQKLQRPLSARTVGRYLNRWHWPDPLTSLKDSPDPQAQAWLSKQYPLLLKRAKAEGGEVFWADAWRSGPSTLLIARSKRGMPYWMGCPGDPGPDEWNAFGERLQRAAAQKIWIVMPSNVNTERLIEDHRMQWVSGNLPLASTSASVDTGSEARPLAAGISGPLSHLDRLEAESIHIMREVIAEADNPVMLYSIGKDSSVMLHLALKAFYPAPLPFPLLHVDTRWKFREMYKFRDQRVKDVGAKLLTHVNPDGIAQGINPFVHGSAVHTDIMKTQGLKQALDLNGFDVAFGGARRDEEKSRAKERIFSFRAEGHRWDPKNQRPELWRLYNSRKRKGESLRVFPLSNWTELDIWLYIHRENIPIVPLYFSAPRPVVERDGMLFMVDDDRMPLHPGETPMTKQVRFRTLGCYPLTAAFESTATTLPDIIQEMLVATTSERQGRMIDFDGAGSMEKKKQEGYF